MVIEAIWALALVGVPIGLFTLAIVWWGMRKGRFLDSKGSRELKLELKAISKQNSSAKNNKPDLLQKKWAKFGGGFYGVVGFFTYIVIEATEIVSLVTSSGGIWEYVKHLDVNAIVQVFVQGFTNFITAIVWPLYWIKRIDMDETWIWFVAAYAGYWLGLIAAQQLHQHRSGQVDKLL